MKSVDVKILALLLMAQVTLGSFAAPVGTRLERTNNTVRLVISPVATTGALFVLSSSDVGSMGGSASVIFQTNTPTPELRLTIPAGAAYSSRGFFKAAQWTGQAPVLMDVSAGSFVMGAAPSEAESASWEGPQTSVNITYGFKIGKFEITQAQYQALMTNNPSYFTGNTLRPVEQVTWTNAVTYCNRLTDLQRAAGCLPTGWAYRLPTEAEWEYACRAGTTTALAYGSMLKSGMANFDGQREYDAVLGTTYNASGVFVDRPVAVGGYSPNPWGLHDMHGNVWEWCLDRWSDNLPGGTVTNPRGPDVGTSRVVRGGSWYNIGRACRSASRSLASPTYKGNEIGFRVVLAPVTP